IEWLEIQAMASGLRATDDALIDRLLEKRRQRVAAAGDSVAAVHLLQGLVEDFGAFRDVSPETARAAALSKRKEIRTALARERDNDDAEARLLDEFVVLEAGLRDDTQR